MNKLNTIKESKYKFEKLSCDSDEHKIVKDFYDKTTLTTTMPDQLPVNYDVYKIIESNKAKILKEKRNNLMLFHGTSSRGVEGILTEGFKNSKNGWFGKGVYLTDCSCLACFYSRGYMFVNEVLKSDNLKIFKQGEYFAMRDHDNKPDHLFENHVYEGSRQLTEKNFKKDCLGRKYRNVAVKMPGEYLADESLVVPRYLIVTGSAPEFFNKFKISEVDSELKVGKPLNLDLD